MGERRRLYLHVNFICHGGSQLDGPSSYSVAIRAFKNKIYNTGTNKAKEKVMTFCFHTTLTFDICIF